MIRKPVKVGMSDGEKIQQADDIYGRVMGVVNPHLEAQDSNITDKFAEQDQNITDRLGLQDDTIANRLASQDNKIAQTQDQTPRYVDSSANILGQSQNKGVALSIDNNHWYYWNGSAYVDSGYEYRNTGQGLVVNNTTKGSGNGNVVQLHPESNPNDNLYPELAQGQVTANNINSSTDFDITNDFSVRKYTLIDHWGDIQTQNAYPYNLNKTIVGIKLDDYNVLKVKNNTTATFYSTACKFVINSESNSIVYTGFYFRDMATAITTTDGVYTYDDGYFIFNTEKIKERYTNAYYISICFSADENIEILDESPKKKLEWLEVGADSIEETCSKEISVTTKASTIIYYTGEVQTYGGNSLYDKHKAIIDLPLNGVIKIKDTQGDASFYKDGYKYGFYDSNKSFIDGVFYSNIPSIPNTNSYVTHSNGYYTFYTDKIQAVYPNAKYLTFILTTNEEVYVVEDSKKKLEWLDISENETITDIYDKIENIGKAKEFEKPFIIMDFDWYADMYGKRYQIMKKEYGFNASFCLDLQTTDYNISDSLTRAQFNEMIESGWDVSLYRGTTDADAYEQIKTLVDQKEAMGIFNPICFNSGNNRNSKALEEAVLANGFKLYRANVAGEIINSPDDTCIGAFYLTSSWLNGCKAKVDEVIAKNKGICFYTHLVIDDVYNADGSINKTDTADASQGHCYEWAFREFLDYVKSKVDAGELEVLTAREYYTKYHPEEAIENDYNRQVKMNNFILEKLNV